MKQLFLILLITTLAACSSVDYRTVDNRLPENVTLTAADKNGFRYVESVRYTYPQPYEQNLSAKCALLNLNNRGVTLKDSSNSFVGLYSGQLYNIESSTRTGDGDILLLNNERMTIAQGVVVGSFDYGIVPIEKYFRFKLVHESNDGQSVYTYSNIESAQSDSGYAENSGFIKVGAWKEAQPLLLIELLDEKTKNLHECTKDAVS